MTQIFFDESGFTGRHLLDPLQRHFVLASSRIPEGDASELLRQSFPHYQGSEFKFDRIWNKAQSRRRLPDFVKAVGKRASDLYIWQIDKRFSLLIKMLEYLMEPTVYDAGFDWYSGYGFRMSNYFQFGLTEVARAPLHENTLRAYYEFARNPSEDGRRALIETLAKLKRRAPEEIKFVYDACIEGVIDFHRHHQVEGFEDTLEIYVTSMLNAVGYWAQRGLTGLELHHDESSAFFRQKGLWSALTSANVGSQLHPVLNGPPIAFPLPVASTIPRRSQDSAGVQLCDLVAGLANKTISGQAQSDPALLAAFRTSDFGEIAMNGVTPGHEFPDGPPPVRMGKDAVDRMVDIIRAGEVGP